MKWIYILLAGLLLLLAKPARANHLVGGEFQLKHLGNYFYELNLHVYGDVAGLSGPQGNEDQLVEVSIFSKQTNQLMETIVMPIISTDFVPYNNTACQTGSVQTKILFYQIQREFLPSVYNSPGGYYVVWERCCRNVAVGNIVAPQTVGLVYYAEFPAVIKNGQPFVNSLPELPPMPPDFLCVGELYQYSMQATDADGDSLAYSLTLPLKGNTSTAVVTSPGLPGPYPPVDWLPGYSLNAMIQGTPALTVHPRTGLISVRPSLAGLFVFAVKCEEFRNGVKIGEVQRDIQVKVNNCLVNNPPTVKVNLPNTTQPYKEGDTLIVSAATNYCYQFNFADPNIGQLVSLKIETANTVDKPQVTPASGIISTNGQVLTGQLCWQPCNPASAGGVFNVNLIVMDNACGGIATDTLRITVKVVRPQNIPPKIVVQGSTAPITFGQAYNFKLISTDVNNDPLTVQMTGRNFDPVALGMKLTPVTGQGQVTSDFSWQLNCGQEILPNGYDLVFRVKDASCYGSTTDSVMVSLRILPEPKDTVEFLPPNIFTPNEDNRNDFFVMPTLPRDNCSDTFQEIRIFNRWGMEVFKSASRQFAWNGKNVSDGIYYYVIRYNKKKYKGHVTIVR